MTLDSPTYFVCDNLILYCNDLNYTAGLDLHVLPENEEILISLQNTQDSIFSPGWDI